MLKNMEKKGSQKTIVIFTTIYLLIGSVFALSVYIPELGTFNCTGTTTDGTSLTIFNGPPNTFTDPDPAHCVRRGLSLKYMAQIPFFTVAWPLIIAKRAWDAYDTTISSTKDEHSDTISDTTRYTPYTSTHFPFSLEYADTVFLLEDTKHRLTFSLLSPDDPLQASSVGLTHTLTFTYTDTTSSAFALPQQEAVTNFRGVRMQRSEEIGEYGGEIHRTYFFQDYNITATYIVTEEHESVFEPMIDSIMFSSLPKVELIDGEHTAMGIFHDTEDSAGEQFFSLPEFGISFQFPNDFFLFEQPPVEDNPFAVPQTLIITPQEPATEIIAYAYAGNPRMYLPESIILTIHHNANSLPLETWLRSDILYSNFHPEEDPTLVYASTTKQGTPVISYITDMALYPTEYISTLHGDWVFIFSASTDLHDDLHTIFDSLTLSHSL